ncbi:hypothetical protein KUTeg_011749 [Tegillarca granosa]|uniref:Uncharacterized protein n=1 Tax=Tegillarca granosa TaxID=220873 RepID=A0ABQ9EXT8_TEGGR|nr:hypothetical protein KUTeg_011749 [Tegillarca granosa]
MQWFVKWESSVKQDTGLKQNEKHLISQQTREDIVSSILGFDELCKHRFKTLHAFIIPSRMNSDVIEKMFCKQRTLHIVNAVILGQVSISRKSNVGCGESAQLYKKPNQEKKIGSHNCITAFGAAATESSAEEVDGCGWDVIPLGPATTSIVPVNALLQYQKT